MLDGEKRINIPAELRELSNLKEVKKVILTTRGEDILFIPYSEENIKFLEILSLFISDFSSFCEFLTYIRRYVVVKQEINEFKTNDFNKLERIALEDTLIRNWRKITKDSYKNFR